MNTVAHSGWAETTHDLRTNGTSSPAPVRLPRETVAALEPPDSSIVEIQARGALPPIYLVHGVGGGMFWGYANLARHFEQERPVYGFKSRGLEGLEEWPSIEIMAAHYVAELRAFQPQGPYRLGGYCFGGNVAYEMARQLQEQGQQTALLALMDCSPPNGNYERMPARVSLRWLAQFNLNLAFWGGAFLMDWTVKERREFIRWKLRVLRKRLGRRFRSDRRNGAGRDVDEVADLSAYSGHQRRLWESHVRALLNYRPRPYAGRIALFRPRVHSVLSSFDAQFGWGDLAAGGVMVNIVAGDHSNMLDEPHVRILAAGMRRRLHEADVIGGQEAPPS